MLCLSPTAFRTAAKRSKKEGKHKHFSDAPCETVVPDPREPIIPKFGGGDDFTPPIRGVGLPKYCKTSVF